ncbi:Rrf2 family transcriptional regulator [Thermobispora bispora]|jgi:Rrf2 family protein|uniref:Transcriptional regulator, BadM/Rrf2 family n=1 Tax=Thermobispora bispora (strain ATCC 19993 / DSM 43833 / CBS 139.67 / JCM 10125 / KCTC 9307 / NBRC 14880 / R51) TaxID=469371 RepID=D6Y803_THEBD|nr:Rrf2 family transcriptional regulator [Thermobispora bispora]MBO2473707.1 Rrf2 family transcriptional regulator [Actinomycetales bacterium]MDI9579517.1 Rrf2 family transcriptional regulator [Thermobispora sp.]ADG87822.1 transcriptional regulator, BadM/Rrf2 family [Thermobispora bispora DSM 43833]MBX6166740.1 Rrf2 family transcriptional regulator [Thermobispora bispora]QSI47719.1 Rrf2 family transcriptional regulator [Thermobispora bispora]
MRLSARVDYALRAAAELAAAGDGPTTVGELAQGQDMPPKYLENILLQMRRAGLVRGQRGPEGGYVLARPANQITLADVIRAVDGPLANVRGERPEEVGYTGAAHALQRVWIALRASERAILERVTLEHVAKGELPPEVEELAADPAAWRSRTPV